MNTLFFRYKALGLLLLCSAVFVLQSETDEDTLRSCPLTCPTGATFCNINAGSLCVTGNASIGGNLAVCGSGGFSGPVAISNATQSTACTNGAFTVSGGAGFGGNVNICGLLAASGITGALAGGLSSVIPYAAAAGTAIGIAPLGTDIAFGVAAPLTVGGIDVISFASHRTASLSRLTLNITNFVGVGSVTATVFTSIDDGVTWVATPLTLMFAANGQYHINTVSVPVAQNTMVALRLVASAGGITLGLSGGLAYT